MEPVTPSTVARRAPAPAATATTAAMLLSYRAELLAGGVPAPVADELVLAAGRTVVHTNGLTASPQPGITMSLAPAGTSSTPCRCARTRGTESR
ncbi:hypothetical protein GCM10009639_53810 [Kitasatospora putterlickiae]|uniref:Uncharacterized protein n=1 Tax=Kitasatospora putterlickiae TaxID=221725 RepID=A0ABN1YDN1_9ACTN